MFQAMRVDWHLYLLLAVSFELGGNRQINSKQSLLSKNDQMTYAVYAYQQSLELVWMIFQQTNCHLVKPWFHLCGQVFQVWRQVNQMEPKEENKSLFSYFLLFLCYIYHQNFYPSFTYYEHIKTFIHHIRTTNTSILLSIIYVLRTQ